MNLIGRLTHEEQYLELNPQGNIDSVLETLHSITPIIQAHHQRAINRLQIICDNLVEELDQHNRTLLTSCDNMIRQIQRCQLWILLHRVLYHCFSCLRRYYPNIILPNLPPVNTSCILDICSHASIDLRDRRTHYRTTFQRLESMLGENNQHNPALLQHKAEMLSTLDKTMQLEGLVLEIRRQIV